MHSLASRDLWKMAESIHSSRSAMSSKFTGLLITNLVLTEEKLGKGADANVFAGEWNGTVCAAKRLHDILLEDESPGGTDKFISNFEAECLTWSKLRHPGVVQFLGVHIDRGSRLPVLVMEKMDTSLRTYLEDHSKEEFPLHQKAFVLRQVTQALAYLHSQNPPLVHHDLSPNNVLLNVVSFVTKVSDFGMSRAINPSTLSRKSSIKGTLAFMAPEALQNPPRYNEKLDVFSFGNVILSTLTHEWPDPGLPNQYRGDQLVALNELERREHCVVKFSAQEKQLFLPIVCQCLENRPDKRPSSVMLVQELRQIESTLPQGSHVAGPIELLQKQLFAKEEECRQKDEVIREKNEALQETKEALKEKDEALKEKNEALKEKNEALKEKNEALKEKNEALKEKHEALKEKDKDLKRKNETLKEKNEALKEKDEALKEKDEALKEKEIVMRTMQADIQQLRRQNSTTSEQLVAKELEGSLQSEEVVREKSATIRAQQAKIQQLRDQLAVSQEVS